MNMKVTRKLRDRQEQIVLAVQMAEYIIHRVTCVEPPMVEDIADKFDVDRATVHRMVKLFAAEFAEDEPAEVATVVNWMRSHRRTSYEQSNLALLVRDMLEHPETWGTPSMTDIANALGTPVKALSNSYERFRDKSWPPLPIKSKGWINQEAAAAAELGDTERLREMDIEQSELLAMRQELVNKRINAFKRKDDRPTQGGEA